MTGNVPTAERRRLFFQNGTPWTFTPINNDEGEFGKTGLATETVVCANRACRRMSLRVALGERVFRQDSYVPRELFHEWVLLPESSAKPVPDYIPEAIRQDYVEACRIRDLSPRASATISRRCLQGMIRDFCGIARRRLIDEINDLKKAIEDGKAPKGVQADTIDAIDHVRNIGNIGAHMEADVDHIIDVDPKEAQTLIDLIELLLEEWYVARNERAQRLAGIGVVAAEKKAAKLASPAKAAHAKPSDGD